MSRVSPWLVAAFTVVLVPSASHAADVQPSPEARAHFEAGVALLQDPDGARYEEAYREFRAAYDASQSPLVLGNLGFCAMKLERDLEAIDSYSRYLETVTDIDPMEREQIKRDLVTLRSSVVRVTIMVKPADATVVDVRYPVRGEPVTNLYSAADGRVVLGIRPGHHVFRARKDSRVSDPWELEAASGSVVRRSLEVAPRSAVLAVETPPQAPSRTLPILTMGLGVVALGAGAVTGVLALDRTDEIAAKCPNDKCSASYDLEGARDGVRTFTTATDALLIGGGALTLTGATWLLLAGSGSRSSARASGACTGSGCVAGVGGRF